MVLLLDMYFKTEYYIHYILLGYALTLSGAESKRSVTVYMPGSLCGIGAREVDGAVVYSSHDLLYANSACTMRFMSDDDVFTSKRLMLKFNRYNVTDCSVSLKIYFRSDAFGSPNHQLSCGDVIPPPIYLDGKYVTLRLDKRTVTGYDFQIVITTFKPDMFMCKEFMCASHKCIDKDLMCDGIDHCFDNSDERSCYNNRNSVVHHVHGGGGSKGFISIPLLVLLALIILIAVLIYRYRRRRLNMTTHGQVIALQQPLYAEQPGVVMTTYQTDDMLQAPPYYNASVQGYQGMQQPPAPYYQPPPQGYPGAPQSAPPYCQPVAQPHPQGYPGQPPYPQQPIPAYPVSQPPYG